MLTLSAKGISALKIVQTSKDQTDFGATSSEALTFAGCSRFLDPGSGVIKMTFFELRLPVPCQVGCWEDGKTARTSNRLKSDWQVIFYWIIIFFNINLFLFIPEECFDDYTIFVEHIPILSQLKPHILFLYRNRCEDAPNFQSAEYTSERYTVLCKAQPDHFYYG